MKKNHSYKKADHQEVHDNNLLINRHASHDNSFSTKNSFENQEVSQFIQKQEEENRRQIH